ncbi:hypothetical protein [Candidatus Annandia pinicola]|uniref:hypothetical protein n=1 Tax=Candidatus Annandia pinicola TaxID=1345117 RepID=UPI001D030DF7|nr:hypothetical protein [Candidatus Annandia pinicola]UDG80462.1 hypothetical protein GFK87_00256 [Candidatus Annandia pinicola]
MKNIRKKLCDIILNHEFNCLDNYKEQEKKEEKKEDIIGLLLKFLDYFKKNKENKNEDKYIYINKKYLDYKLKYFETFTFNIKHKNRIIKSILRSESLYYYYYHNIDVI